MSRYSLLYGVCFATLVAAVPVRGQIQPVNPDSALQHILDTIEGTPLKLEDAVDRAVENATDARSAEASYRSALGVVRREAGAFDPALFFSFDYADQKTPTATFFSGAPVLNTVQTTARGGIRMSLPFGTDIEASLNTVRLQTNSSFASLNPQYTTFGAISVRQPLLGGFLASGNKDLAKAEQDLDAAKARYDQQILAVRAQVEQTYWDLYAGERDYAVQRLVREQAVAFLRDTETRAKTGLVGPNQVASAKTFLAEQEILSLDREEQLDRFSDRLSSLIGMKPPEGSPRLTAVDHPPDQFAPVDVDNLVREAMDRNLALQAAQKEVASQRILSTAAFWDALPQVDVVGSLGGNGLAGTGREISFNGQTFPAPQSAPFGDAVSQALKRDYPTWSLGVEVSIPIGLRSGLGEQDRLEAEVAIAEQRAIAYSRSLEEQVRASYRELEHGQRRLKAAREGVAAAQEQVRIGLIEFQNGRTTAFELVRLGADFAGAQQRYSQALVRSAKAAANLKQLTSGAFPGAN